MSFWIREIVGWLLVVVGLYLMAQCYGLIQEKRVMEAGPLVIVSIVVFRGGIHLLKVAIAARICREARDRARPAKAAVRAAPRIMAQPGRGG